MTSPADSPERPRLLPVWGAAAALGLLASCILYGSHLGANYPIWLTLAAAILAAFAGRAGARRQLAVPLCAAVLLGGGIALTADGGTQFLDLLLSMSLLGLATMIAARPLATRRAGPVVVLAAPFVAALATFAAAVQTVAGSGRAVGWSRLTPRLRGAILATPLVLLFALLFADADPLFARGRDAVTDLFSSWDFIPRLCFFAVVTLAALGAYALAAGREPLVAPGAPSGERTRLAERAPGEWTVIIGAVAAICWLFTLLQIVYTVSDAPARIGSGVTYAGYVHRGFAELTTSATIAVLLITLALASRSGETARRTVPPSVRTVAFALLAAVACILVTAFHRIVVYENAYGYTTARIQAQAYMLGTFAVLALCAVESVRGFDLPRFTRQVMVVILAGVVTMTYWNDQAWIVRQDVARFAGTRQFDAVYLAGRLSGDAYPALVAELPKLPPDQRAVATCELHNASRRVQIDAHWYEWNARRSAARDALRSIAVSRGGAGENGVWNCSTAR